ncbi:DUF805 domain-containing protein [Maridesulfovibrio sp. FT414]|uniref:DUF805 domain-containing protein n=1 Tax=Maridesulfovibrio sp. FT414 TaxID=2979469 RepID=UPI003D8033D4
MKYYFEIWKKFNDFHSSSSRGEFVHFMLIHIAIICVLAFLGYSVEHPFAHKVINTVSGLFIVGSLLSCAAVIVRRLNALGMDRRLVFTALVPVVGLLYLFVVCLRNENAKKSDRFLNIVALFQRLPGRQRA